MSSTPTPMPHSPASPSGCIAQASAPGGATNCSPSPTPPARYTPASSAPRCDRSASRRARCTSSASRATVASGSSNARSTRPPTPGLWDTLMGGLQSAGESDAQTLESEIWDLAGLRIADLHELRAAGRIAVRRPVADGCMVEHIEVFATTVPDAMPPPTMTMTMRACLESDMPGSLARYFHTVRRGLHLGDALPSVLLR